MSIVLTHFKSSDLFSTIRNFNPTLWWSGHWRIFLFNFFYYSTFSKTFIFLSWKNKLVICFVCFFYFFHLFILCFFYFFSLLFVVYSYTVHTQTQFYSSHLLLLRWSSALMLLLPLLLSSVSRLLPLITSKSIYFYLFTLLF